MTTQNRQKSNAKKNNKKTTYKYLISIFRTQWDFLKLIKIKLNTEE